MYAVNGKYAVNKGGTAMKKTWNIFFILLAAVCMTGFAGIGAAFWGKGGAWSQNALSGYMGTEAMGAVWAAILAFMAAAWSMVLIKTRGRGGWGFALLGALSALYSYILFYQQSAMGALMLALIMAANMILLFFDCAKVSLAAAAVALPPAVFFGYIVYVSYGLNAFV